MSEKSMCERIIELAAGPNGFSTGELSGHSVACVYERCRELVQQGKLFRAAAKTKSMRYFTTVEAALNYDRQRMVNVGAKHMSSRAAWAKDAKVVFNSKTKVTICPSHAPRFQYVSLPFVHSAIQSGRVLGES